MKKSFAPISINIINAKHTSSTIVFNMYSEIEKEQIRKATGTKNSDDLITHVVELQDFELLKKVHAILPEFEILFRESAFEAAIIEADDTGDEMSEHLEILEYLLNKNEVEQDWQSILECALSACKFDVFKLIWDKHGCKQNRLLDIARLKDVLNESHTEYLELTDGDVENGIQNYKKILELLNRDSIACK